MKKKFAIVFCIHHKPWLIMATIISTILQNLKSYDIFFLYNKGSGEKYYKEQKLAFERYDKLKKKYGKNIKLDDTFDPFLTKVCKLKANNIYEIDLDDDHALDSGAWYKFIGMNRCKNYTINIILCHMTSKAFLTVLEFLITECMNYIVTIWYKYCSWHIHSDSCA